MRRTVSGITAGIIVAGGLVAVAPPAYAADESVSYPAPDYLKGELTGDLKIDTDDLSLLLVNIGATSADPVWPQVAAADLDGDGTISIVDVSLLSKQYLYDDGDFELLETSIVDIQKAMTAGSLTSAELTAQYLQRIGAYDRTAGIDTRTTAAAAQMFESIIASNPDAMAQAAALDAERATTGPRSILHGVPFIVKDNINTVGMATTAGCACLSDNVTDTDAETVERLRAAGAVLIAKANLSEFAQSTVSSISKFGTTMNAYRLDKNSGGSSGGSGASVSANFAPFSLGTDTGGSVRVPASFNSVVGIRPTIGLVSREGVIPLDLYRDTVGPLARTVSDAALALDALAGSDPLDAVTAGADAAKPVSYVQGLDAAALKGKRIGYITGLVSGTADAVGFRLVDDAKADLRAAGATVVDVGAFGNVAGYALGSLPSSRSFTHDMDEYLDTYYEDGYTFLDLAEKVAESERVSPNDDMSSWPSSTIRGWATTTEAERDAAYPTFLRAQQAMRARVDQLMAQYQLDALIYPSTGGVVESPGSNNRISAYSGYPAISVPMGFADSALDATSHDGTPMGLEFLAEPYSEAKLISYAYAYEQQSQNRRPTAVFPALD
ncbi:amidase family protein [Herbiconiux sp. L3-i23]|uniref:amidase family protein n=1 Tax=Herbiconiux sp. L3-i23 TaxID=2905871 RepID=UPI0020464398|nr:amidase family protein [Herbiconiux sp. L3-i23]BDI21755.1 amidase [Herbiconiux sp. L3-i23]